MGSRERIHRSCRRLGLFVALAVTTAIPASADFAEVSGPGETPFLLAPAGWSYEEIPGVTYTFYRSTSPDTGYVCIHDGHTGPGWEGDATPPPPGGIRYYLVTAFNVAGEGTAGGPGRDAGLTCSP